MKQKLQQCLLFLLALWTSEVAYTQCIATVDNVFFHCRPENPGSYYLVFRVNGDANTFNIIDLNGNVANNSGFFADDITDGETATTNPIILTGTNDSEYRYFGPITDGTNIDVVLVDIGAMVCDTIEIFEGNFNCDVQSEVCGPDLPFYNMDFTLSTIDSFLIIERGRGEGCSDSTCVPGNGKRCFEFRVILTEDIVGLQISDSGSGSPAGELYSANEMSPTLCQDLFDSNPGGANETSICLAESNTYIIMSCKQGGNTTSAVISAIRRPSAPQLETAEPCNIELTVENAGTVSWSSPDDPNLDNFSSCSMDSISCFFLYDEAVFGPVTECEGDTFMYIVSAMPSDTTCIGDIELLDTGRVIVYPIINVMIDSFCDPLTPDSLTLTATVVSSAVGCPYNYIWSTGDTTESIRVEADGALYSVTISRADLPIGIQSCVVASDSIFANAILMVDCSMLGDSLYQCVDDIPMPDTALVNFTGCGGGGIIFVSQNSNGGAGCIDDTLLINRYYIIDFDGDTINTTTDRDTCAQLFTIVDETTPELIQDSCPPDTVIDCTITDLSNLGMPAFTDNCTDQMDIELSFRDDTLAGFGICSNDTLGIIMRTWFAMDNCGNVDSSCALFIALVDTIPPDLSACGSLDLTVECDASNNMANAMAWDAANIVSLETCASDACDTDLEGQVTSNFNFANFASSCGNAGSLTVTYTITDDCGNASSFSATLSIEDNTGPMITCPGTASVECGESTDPVDTGMATATDNCDPAVIVGFTDTSTQNQDDIDDTCDDYTYTITRTWTATDACGNSSSCTQIINVTDDTAPMITCPSTANVECDESTDPGNTGTATATDNCDPSVIITSSDVSTQNLDNIDDTCDDYAYVITRTWVATDACGNSSSCTQIINVSDDTAPMITCPGDLDLVCDDSTDPADTGMATATDNCDPNVTINSSDMTTQNADGIDDTCDDYTYTITRTWTATDACGNSASCTQTINVVDDTAPNITCPIDASIECNGSTDPSVTGMATAIDDCDPDVTISFSDSGEAGNCASEGILRTWTAVDACGNSSTCTQRIFIDDTIDPVITCPPNASIQCDESTAPANTGMATATDNCDLSVTVTFNDVSGQNQDGIDDTCDDYTYVITRTWTAMDDCGNTSTCTQLISVTDDTAPMITCPPTANIECDESIDPANTGTATAIDNCDPEVTVEFSDSSTQNADDIEDTCDDYAYVITRTWTATDACGNSSTCTQIINVADNSAPVVTCPPTANVECDDSIDPIDTGMPTAIDNCDPSVTFDFSDVTSQNLDGIEDTCDDYTYVITRTWTATDACGNSGTCTQIINVVDGTAPVITCPGNTTIECDASTDPADTGMATATDNCDPDITIGYSDASNQNADGIEGTCDDTEYVITRTWTATDACGNSSTCTQIISLMDTTPPDYTPPADATIDCIDDIDDTSLTGTVSMVSDNCSSVEDVDTSFTDDLSEFNMCDGSGIVIRTYVLTDACGNAASQTQIITIEEMAPPVLIFPPDTIIDCDVDYTDLMITGEVMMEEGSCGALLIDTILVVDDEDLEGCNGTGTILRTFIVEDVCGNSSTGTQVITVQDTTPPVAICMDITADFMGEDMFILTPDMIDNGSFDACGPVTLEADVDTLSCEEFDGMATVTLTVTDECGLSSTCTAEVTFMNSSSIEVECPDTIFIIPVNGTCDVILEYEFNFFDLCGGGFTIEQVDTSGFMLGDTLPLDTCFEQMFVAYNEFGDTARCNFFVKVGDQPEEEIFACKSEINVSLDENCQIVVTPGLLLVGGQYGCINNYLIQPKDDTVTLINGNIIDESYVGQTIAIMVTNLLTGNACWTLINVEDKLGPALDCVNETIFCYEDRSPESIGFPVPDTVTVVPTGETSYDVLGFGNCGVSTLEYFDEIVYGPCTGPYSEHIIRHWTATDARGNKASCNDTIWVLRVGLEEITLPPHFDGTDQPPLECGSVCILPGGIPDVECTGQPGGNLCSNIYFDFEDHRVNKCGGSFSVNRIWRIINFCNGNRIQYIQRIKVLDTTPPSVTCLDTLTVSTGPWDCLANVELPLPEILDDCSETEVKVFSPLGPVPQVGGTFLLQGIGIGHHEIIYQVNDACYNQVSCTMILKVIDEGLPLVVCDLHTTVTITEYDSYGLSLVDAADLSDGSYDACGDIEVYGRRMDSCIDFDWTTNGAGEDRVPNGQINELDEGLVFRKRIPFACCDAGSGPVIVELKIVDESGNSNTCMVEVKVQDKLLPSIVCPPDISFACQIPFVEDVLFDIDDRTFGTVVQDEGDRQPVIFNGQNWGIDGLAKQACGLELFLNVNDQRDECGVGTIYRHFTAMGAGGSKTCTQTITVFNPDPFYINPENDNDPTDDVVWPNDTTIIGSCDTDPVDSGEPLLLGDFCDITAASFSDAIFGDLEGTCSKVVRTWQVIDWCQYNGVGAGVWEYIQIIKVINTEGPEALTCDDLVLCQDDPEMTEDPQQPCTAILNLTQPVVDDCTPAEDIEWWYRVDLDNDGSFEISSNHYTGAQAGATIDMDGILHVLAVIQGLDFNDPHDPSDMHFIEWNFRDHCSQETACGQGFRLEDCKPPSAICQAISGNLMPNGEFEIWASDFNASSNDNCTAAEDLVYSFSGDEIVPSIILTCQDVEDAQSNILELNVWVWDEWGNTDFCVTTFTVDNAGSVCGPEIAPIAGFIETETEEAVSKVAVDLQVGGEHMLSFHTESDGHYLFEGLDMHEQYMVTPMRNDNHKNGVTTLDLIRIQQHILGLLPLESPYRRIAADANNSQSITASDILEIRKLILGVFDEFPNNTSWRFVDAAFAFPDPYAPWPFTEMIMIDPLEGPTMESDFIGIKVGDVNGTVSANLQQIEIRKDASVDLFMHDQLLQPGVIYEIPVRISQQMPINGLQLELLAHHAVIHSIEKAALDIRPENRLQQDDWLRISWHHHIPTEIKEGVALFTITLEVQEEQWLHNALRIGDQWFNPAVYQIQGLTETKEFSVQLDFREAGEVSNFELFQNDPNPWSDVTEIGFMLPRAMKAQFHIYDQFGKFLLAREIDASAGMNVIKLEKKDIGASGVLYFRLQADGFVATRKMIVIR